MFYFMYSGVLYSAIKASITMVGLTFPCAYALPYSRFLFNLTATIVVSSTSLGNAFCTLSKST